MALGFRDSEALQVVLASGLCPAGVAEAAARVARVADGRLVLEPALPLARAALGALQRIGVAVDAALPDDARDVRCWAEVIAPVRAPLRTLPALVLLVTERAEGLIDLAAELVRLGCDRLDMLATADGGLMRVIDPPTYTLERALDREAGLRAYAPAPGVGGAVQEAVWIELGYRHPLASALRAAPGTLLLVAGDGWRVVPAGDRGAGDGDDDAGAGDGWRGLDAALALTVPGTPAAIVPVASWPRRSVELRLAGGRRAVTSLWVMRRAGVAAIDQLLSYLPDDVVARLSFAVGTAPASADGADGAAGEPVVIVRARSRRQPAPDLALPAAEAYAPLVDLPDIYAPSDAIVEPPLRRDRLRAILGATDRDVLWLARSAPGAARFRVERIADSAFQPLPEWADYVLHASARELAPWMRATELAFAPFVSNGLEWASGPTDDAGDDKPRKSRAARAAPAVREPPQPAPAAAAQVADDSEPAAVEPLAPRGPRELAVDDELAALERQFVALDAAGDAPERMALLARLGVVYARLGRRRDAGLCFARTVWEAPAPEAMARLEAWIAADGGLGRTRGGAAARAFDAIVANQAPAADDVRLVAAVTATGDARLLREPHQVQRWLDDHDGELDARTQWLARLGLARMAGGDPLGLAHARDRILGRLASGLSIEHELPAFLRLAGRTGALGSASGEHLSRALDELSQRIARTRRRRSLTEAPAQYTGAYVQLQLAHGFARIGGGDRARELTATARDALAAVAGDPVHGYLIAAFTARIDQAIAGAAPETPLPDALGARLAALDRMARYKVDRLREVSRILEPVERPNALGGFSLHHDARGPEFAALRTLADARSRGRAVAALVDTAGAPATGSAERARLLDGVFDVLLELPEADAAPSLARAWPLIAGVEPARQAALYAEALVVAGHFGRDDALPELLARLNATIRVVAGADLERVLQIGLRALRRIGLRGEIAQLLADAEQALPATGPDALRGRLALAAGIAYLGDDARAEPILAQASGALAADFAALTDPKRTGPNPGPMRPLELTRALASAYAYMPLTAALAGITGLTAYLKDVTDNFGTNSHYCLAVLHFVESLVLGITSEDLAIGEAGRRFIEDDEHLIRRRLHRDLEART